MRQMSNEEKKQLGQKIKSARKQSGLSQEQLAYFVGYKVGTISKYEQGYRIPDISILRKISIALGCNLSELMSMSDEVISESSRLDNAVECYIDWLRSVHIMLVTPNYEKREGREKATINVYIDGIPLDISDVINEIMEMGKEHFKLLAKHIGKNVFEI